MEPKYYHELIGGNFRLDEIQAAVLNVKLPHLDAWSAARQRNAAFYDAAFARAGLGGKVRTPPPAAPAARATSITSTASACERRDELRALARRSTSVGAEIYYPLPLHMQQCFAYLGAQAGGLSGVAARLAGNAGAADLPGADGVATAVRSCDTPSTEFVRLLILGERRGHVRKEILVRGARVSSASNALGPGWRGQPESDRGGARRASYAGAPIIARMADAPQS